MRTGVGAVRSTARSEFVVQLARLYWRWNTGDLAAEEATKMAYVLKVMHGMVEGTETARRLADLEAKVAELASHEHDDGQAHRARAVVSRLADRRGVKIADIGGPGQVQPVRRCPMRRSTISSELEREATRPGLVGAMARAGCGGA